MSSVQIVVGAFLPLADPCDHPDACREAPGFKEAVAYGLGSPCFAFASVLMIIVLRTCIGCDQENSSRYDMIMH